MDRRPPINEKRSIVIVACRVMVPELEKACDQDSCVEIRYLDQWLHRTPGKMAAWAMKEELKHYTHIALINTGIGDLGSLRERAKENAHFFGKEYKEIYGNLTYLRKLTHGPYEEEDFFFIPPGQKIAQEIFLSP